MSDAADTEKDLFTKLIGAKQILLPEIQKVVIGQAEVIDQLLITIFSGSHCLIMGPPGLAKTLLVNTLAMVLGLDFRRIQFTPDLMPSDIIGTEILEENADGQRSLARKLGPIFSNLVLADEINRTPPKTQAALLEAMQEKQVTLAGDTLSLPSPFFVLATQNPIEMEGTYPLPEAQLDRFLLNTIIDYLPEEDEVSVVQRTTGSAHQIPDTVFQASELVACQKFVRDVPVAEDLVRYAVRLVTASRPKSEKATADIQQWVRWGAGTRASQSLILAAKARAVLDNRPCVDYEDIAALAKPVLRHRILTTYRAEAEAITVEQVIEHLLENTSIA